MISKKKVAGLIYDRIEELDNGLFVVSLIITTGNKINVELDKHEGGVSVKDCMSVSRNIEHNLDREQEDFELHVSSAGLDKGLRVYAQYQKNVGRDVVVKTNDDGKVEGKMIEATPDQITVQTTRKERIEGKKKKQVIIEDIVISMDKVKETKIVISFK
ncbi:MAG: ribosome assembly cofactor RimP [Fluviicola sp.]|nr:ribosome assembly cofactor RimP [Fluviicola sp.]